MTKLIQRRCLAFKGEKMKIGIHEAKTNLSKLIPAVLSGEEVIITKSGQPMVKIVPIEENGSKRQVGIYAGKIKYNYNFEDPLPVDVIEDFWNN